jgi:hypothetical protein
VWDKIVEWLQFQRLESSVQSYLSIEDLDAESLRKQELTDRDTDNLRTLLSLELSFLRSQVWLKALRNEFDVVEHEGKKLYVFQLTKSLKRASTTSHGSLPASTR